MKNYIKLLIAFWILMSLTWCFTTNKDIEDAKKDLGIIKQDTKTEIPSNPIDKIPNEVIEEEVAEEKEDKKIFVVSHVSGPEALDFDSFEIDSLQSWELEITWTTKMDVDSIIVEFSNNESDFPDDKYQLKQFKSWDEKFLYRAFSRYETLDYGLNTYLFKAKVGDSTSISKLVIEYSKKEEKKVDLLDVSTFPESNEFGTPRFFDNDKVTYSDIKGLEITKKEKNENVCAKNPETGKYYVSEILKENLDWYFWWNTCRPIWKEQGISFNVLRLKDLSYIYERHYILNNGLYGIYELEKEDEFVLEDDNAEAKVEKLKIKNTELKDKEYKQIERVDNLFDKLKN